MNNENLPATRNGAVATTDPTVGMAMPPKSILEFCSTLPQRDLAVVQNRIKEAVVVHAEIARQCIYCKPVGKKNNKQTFALGPSVRLTEIGHNEFGRIWLDSRVIEETNEYLIAKTIAFDMINLNIVPSEKRRNLMSKGYRDSPPKRFPEHVVDNLRSATLSITRRDALMQIMRAQLMAIMPDIKKKIISDLVPGSEAMDDREVLKQVWPTMVAMFNSVGVTEAEMKEAIVNEKNPTDKIILLIGIKNAITDGHTSIDDAFGKRANRKPINQQATSPDGSDSTGKDGKPPKRNEKQIYNTIMLELQASIYRDEADQLVEEMQKELGYTVPKFKAPELKKLNEQLQKILDGEGDQPEVEESTPQEETTEQEPQPEEEKAE